jgi:catechol 2,3-dioxygenase-like lactoylglutathione lyase family enzyme
MLLPKPHIHLTVRDANRSVAFYEALLDSMPTRRSEDSATFDLDAPPLLLTIEHRRQVAAGHSRYALLVDDPRRVGHAAISLRRAGVRLKLEDQGIEAQDPDGNSWRVRLAPSSAGLTVVAI